MQINPKCSESLFCLCINSPIHPQFTHPPTSSFICASSSSSFRDATVAAAAVDSCSLLDVKSRMRASAVAVSLRATPNSCSVSSRALRRGKRMRRRRRGEESVQKRSNTKKSEGDKERGHS